VTYTTRPNDNAGLPASLPARRPTSQHRISADRLFKASAKETERADSDAEPCCRQGQSTLTADLGLSGIRSHGHAPIRQEKVCRETAIDQRAILRQIGPLAVRKRSCRSGDTLSTLSTVPTTRSLPHIRHHSHISGIHDEHRCDADPPVLALLVGLAILIWLRGGSSPAMAPSTGTLPARQSAPLVGGPIGGALGSPRKSARSRLMRKHL
jgi:hypothetical protein